MSARLLEAGYAVFCPQLFLTWKKKWGPFCDQYVMDFQLKQVGGSLAALHLHMLGKIADWILSRGDVIGNRIGFCGLSYGGLNALMFGAFDPRVAAVVSSCIVNDPFKHASADRTWFGSAEKFSYEEMCSMICPRPLYMEFSTRDQLFSPEGARAVARHVRRIYTRLGFNKRLETIEFDGRHEFNPGDAPIRFLERHFPPYLA